jgi:hypothetical protein
VVATQGWDPSRFGMLFRGVHKIKINYRFSIKDTLINLAKMNKNTAEKRPKDMPEKVMENSLEKSES